MIRYIPGRVRLRGPFKYLGCLSSKVIIEVFPYQRCYGVTVKGSDSWPSTAAYKSIHTRIQDSTRFRSGVKDGTPLEHILPAIPHLSRFS